MILVGGLPLLLAIGSHAWLLALGWMPVWAVLIVLVAVPVRGRSAFRWATDSVFRCIGVVMGWTDWQSKARRRHGREVRRGRPARSAVRDPHARRSAVRAAAGPAGDRGRQPGTDLGRRRPHHPPRYRAGRGRRTDADGQRSVRAAGGRGDRRRLVSLVALQIRTVPDDGAERAAWQQTNLRRDAPPLALAVDAELAPGDGRRPACGTKRSSPSSCPSTASPSRPRKPAAASTAVPACCTG